MPDPLILRYQLIRPGCYPSDFMKNLKPYNPLGFHVAGTSRQEELGKERWVSSPQLHRGDGGQVGAQETFLVWEMTNLALA